MKPLKIMHIAHVRWYNAEAQYALELARTQASRGHRVTILTQAGSPVATRAREAGLRVVEERGFNAKGFGGLVGPFLAAHKLKHRLKRGGYDVLTVHRPEGLPLIALAGRLAGAKTIRMRGDMRPVRKDPFNRWVHTKLLDAVVTSNSKVAADLASGFKLAVLPKVIPGGVDPLSFSPDGPQIDLFNSAEVEPGGFTVGILGRMGKVKGHEDFIEAARIALQRGADCRFVVIVKEPHPKAELLKARVTSDTLLNGKVGFIGHCADLPVVLRSFDLGVVASTGSEAHCRVGLEWMSSGVPLLATRIGVLPDLVSDGETGCIVEPGSPEMMAEKIAELASDGERVRRMGEAARARTEWEFTLERCADEHERLYSELLGEE